MRGAEAVLRRISVLGIPAVEKFRLEKKYRQGELDFKIRSERTRREARLLHAAKRAGVLCPIIYEVGDYFIRMKFLEGKMLYKELEKREIKKWEINSSADILVKLHSQNIIHGDFTPANLMVKGKEMAVIDFGLGLVSPDVEDKATDVVTMKKALGKRGVRFVEAYEKHGGKKSIVKLAEEIEKRARYMERG